MFIKQYHIFSSNRHFRMFIGNPQFQIILRHAQRTTMVAIDELDRRLISGENPPCPKWSSQGRAFKWFQANTQTWKLHFNGRNPSFVQHFPPTKSTSKDSVKWSVETGAPHVLWMIRGSSSSASISSRHLLIWLPQHHPGVDSLKQS